MKRAADRAAALFAAALAFPLACAGPTPDPPSAAAPAPARARRAVLVSFDAVAGERLAELLEEPGKLPYGGFRGIADRGFFARRCRPPTPSLTAVSHATHVTGAMPERTGIVANEMLDLDRSKPFGTPLSGFDAPIRAETLWQAAHRQGKKVGVVLYPGADGKTPERAADWGMRFVLTPLSTPRLQTIPAGSWSDDDDARGSFSPARATTLALSPTSHAIVLVALDATDDGRRNYDRLRIESAGQAPVEARPGEWFAVEVSGEKGRTGAWCKLLRLSPDLSETELYVGGLSRNLAYPEEFRRSLDERVGFWPGTSDASAFGADSAHPEIFLEQADRLADFLTRAAEFAAARPDWDLLLVYQPEVDEVSHEFFLKDPRQHGYTPERAARFAGFVDAAYALADRSLARIARALGPDDALFVTSDHGMAPLLTAVYPDEILREAGLLQVQEGGRIAPSSAAVAITSSGVANVYVNPAAPPGTLAAVEKALSDFRVEGASPWDRLVRRADARDLGLDGPASGDLIALARPGISLTMRVTPGRTTGTPAAYGGHGYRNAFPALDATFLAAGPGIARERVEEFPSWRIAARVSRALGIQPPASASP